MGHKLLSTVFTLICIRGLCATILVPSQNPVAVGSNVTISLNESMSISVGVWLFGPSTLFMWFPGGIISGSSNQGGIEFNSATYNLTLLSVTLKSSGLYVLESLSPIKTRLEIALDVQEPVSNVSANVSSTSLVEFNSTVTFKCSASGSPLRYSWQNGSSVVTTGGRVTLSNDGSSLIINSVTRYDEGPFKCIVKNDINEQQSIQMNLNISYGPSNPTMTLSPERIAYSSGSTISLSCSADSKPAATFYWMYNGSLLNINQNPSYTLTNTTQNQTGQYTCVAQNAVTLRNAAVAKTIRIVDPISAVVVNPSGYPVKDMPFNLSCNVVGPVDSIQWMKNGMYLYADNAFTFFNGNSTMSFHQLALSDDGLYQCAASSAVSNITSLTYNLAVNYGPINTSVSGPDVVAVGTNVTFNCSSYSRPESYYSWYFGGLNVANGSVYVTTALSYNYSGQYTCVAFNNITGKSSNGSVTLTVLVPVSSVMVNMDNQQPIFNQNFTLTCHANGDVQQIQWMKNGLNLYSNDWITFSNSNSVLNFNPLSLTDDGQYWCKASNAISNKTSPAYDLKVFYGPWNTTISGPAVGAVGRSVSFSCSANSHPASQYSWWFNSSQVGYGPVYESGVLLPNSSGQYTCVAFNNITGIRSNTSLELTLKYPVSSVTVDVGHQQPVFSHPFNLTCTATGDVEHIMWMKNGIFLYPGNGITFSSDNSTLSFHNLTLSDDGHYQCEASNSVSNMTSLAYHLMVNYGPWNITVKGPRMAETGSNVTFICTANSRPHSQYSWFHNSSQVGVGPVYVKSALSLDNSGQYTCRAFNNITGINSTTTVYLTVIDAITTVDVIADSLIPLASQKLKLTCNVKGPYNKIHWLKNNQTVQQSPRVTISADNTSVTFNPLQTADDGRYHCVAANALREHFSHPYDLAVIFGPQSVQIIVRPGIPPVLTCLALSQPPAVYHWILENNTVVGNQSSIQLPIKSILGSNYTCVATNPLTNVTVYTSQVVSYPDSAISIQASVVLMALLALLIPVLEEWLLY